MVPSEPFRPEAEVWPIGLGLRAHGVYLETGIPSSIEKEGGDKCKLCIVCLNHSPGRGI